MPKISIIVPVYKAEKYIEACTTAILEQTEPDFELLLVDDGSPDASGAICDRLAKTDSRIRVLHKQNGGASSARNFGLREARGEYIMFCDSDDRPTKDWCKELLSAMEQGDADLCVCGFTCVRDGKAGRASVIESDGVQPVDTDLWTLYEIRQLNTPWNKIFRRSVIEENGLQFDETMTDGEDQHFNLLYLQSTKQRIRVIPKALYLYTEDNASSVTSRFIPRMWEQKKKSYALLYRLLFEEGTMKKERLPEFYGSLIDAVSRVLNNNMASGNKASTCQKIRMNSKILRDSVCREALKKGCCKTLSKRYIRLLKLRTYLPAYLAGKLR